MQEQTASPTMYSHISQQEAATELLARRQARKSLLTFTKRVAIEPPPAEHHLLLIDALQDVEDSVIDRLMVLMPPGSAKSTYASVLFPAHYMGRFDDKKVISGSYEQGLATRFGRRVRNLTESLAYQSIFQTDLTQDSKAKGEWELKNGSAYLAVGVGSGVTGNRADGAVIDDPIKGRKEADSATVRDTTWDWWEADLNTRLKPNAWVVMILTRWHQDDPAGRILPEDWDGESGDILCRDGRVWRVICLPAQAKENDPLGRKPGEWLWTDWFSLEWWQAKQRETSPRNWGSLYQQTPKPDEGTYFKRKDFWRFDLEDMPAVRKYQTSDFAVTEPDDENDPDYTSTGIHGTEAHEGITKLYLGIAGWHGQEETGTWFDHYFDLTNAHKPLCEFAEVGVIRRAIEGFMTKERRNRKAWGKIEWVSHIGDKAANARALQGMSQMGLVGIANTPHGDWLMEQLMAFPAGKHDDGVDEAAMIARVIDEAHPAMAMPPPPTPGGNTDAWGRPKSTSNWKTG